MASLVHEEQLTKTCPRSNVLDAKNMDTMDKNNKRKREEVHITQEVEKEGKKQKKEDPLDLYYD